MPPKTPTKSLKKPTPGTPGKKASKSTTTTTTTTKTKKNSAHHQQTAPKMTQSQFLAQQLQHLYSLHQHVQHNLSLLPTTAVIPVSSTLSQKFLSHFKDEREIETGIILGYLRHTLQLHPFTYRRDYNLTQQGKFGGFPSWLVPTSLPSTTCSHCSAPMTFLLQLSSPIPTLSPEEGSNDENYKCETQLSIAQRTFHRQLYIFICLNNACAIKHNSIKVFRAQLPLENPFYGREPIQFSNLHIDQTHDFSRPAEVLARSTENEDALCVICGAKAVVADDNAEILYCCEMHKMLNTTIYRLNTNKIAANDLDQIKEQHEKLISLESTVILPRFGICTDNEVLEDDILVVHEDFDELALQQSPTTVDVPSKIPFLPENSAEQDVETENHTVDDEEPPQEVPINEEDISDEQKTQLITDEADIKKILLTQVNDPELKSKLDSYFNEESGKSFAEKLSDLQTFSNTFDEADNNVVTQQDGTFTYFTKRTHLTLPPYFDEYDVDPIITPYSTAMVTNFALIDSILKKDNINLDKQILRYYPYRYRSSHKDSQPLWLHQINRLDCGGVLNSEDPAGKNKQHLICPYCNGKRVLELQVMPYVCTYLLEIMEKQLKSSISIQTDDENKQKMQALADSLSTSFDFGTIAVYTCQNSCDYKNINGDVAYAEEFAYIQPSI